MPDVIDEFLVRFGRAGRLEKAAPGILIHRWLDEEFDAPVLLRVTPVELATTVRENAEDAEAAFGDGGANGSDPGWWLLFTHLDEALSVRNDSQHVFVLHSTGVVPADS